MFNAWALNMKKPLKIDKAFERILRILLQLYRFRFHLIILHVTPRCKSQGTETAKGMFRTQ